MYNTMPKQVYCFDVPHVETLWSTRAIYEKRCSLIVVVDKNQGFSKNKKDYDNLLNWLVETGWPNFKNKVEELKLSECSYERIKYSDGNYEIIGTPNCSYGYFYIIAYPVNVKMKTEEI
jgi:hypothetical protein